MELRVEGWNGGWGVWDGEAILATHSFFLEKGKSVQDGLLEIIFAG